MYNVHHELECIYITLLIHLLDILVVIMSERRNFGMVKTNEILYESTINNCPLCRLGIN